MKKIKVFISFLLLLSTISLVAQEKLISGTITDENAEPLPGVNIVIQGTTTGVQTDFEGNYTINTNIGDVLVFTFVGMKTQTYTIKASDATINIVLAEDVSILDEVVIVGFGTKKKVNLTGSVSVVDSKALADRPVTNVAAALQGAVAGMNFSVNNAGGALDNSVSFNIRGSGTIGAGSSGSPLVLIDGMEGNMNTLNPQDIESISVLKDAASSSIYGSRAPFGVILITTKSGKDGKITVNYNNNFRSTSPILQPNMLDSESFATYWNEAAANAGQSPKFSDDVMQKIRDHRAGTLTTETDWNSSSNNWNSYTGGFADNNWFDIFYKDAAASQEHNLSVNGGTEKVNYYLSANYLDQEGLLNYGNDQYDRYSVNSKISAKISEKLKLTYLSRLTRIDYERSSYQSGLFFHNIARRWPTVPLRDPNGNYVYGNEIAHLENGRNKDQNDELVQQLNVQFTPIKNWNIYANMNYKISNSFNHNEFLPIYSYDEDGVASPAALQYVLWASGGSRIYESGYKSNYFSPNVYTDYTLTLNEDHEFKVMAGYQSELTKTRNLGVNRDDVITTSLPTINTSTGDTRGYGGYQHWAIEGYFGRLNYNYKDKYLLEVNGRYDGSSRFLDDKRWQFFPSFSAGWNISNENFYKDSKLSEHVSLLKLRGSYGELGNQNTNNWYPFYPSMGIGVDNGNWLVNGAKPNTAYPPGLVSTLLTWERVTSWNVGLDVRAFNSRLGLGFDVYNRTTFDMVGPAPELPGVLGANPPSVNNTDMESKGFDLEISWRDSYNDFSYGAKFILSDTRQFVTSYPNESGNLNQWYSGREFGEIWGYTTKGIAKSDAEMNDWLAQHNQDRMGSNWAAGDMMYQNLDDDPAINNGSNTLDDHGDLSVIGNSTPRYSYSIDFDANYKGFDFRAFFQGVAKRDVAVGGPYFSGANSNMWQSAGFTNHLDYFRPEDTTSPFGPNTDSYYPRPLFDSGWKNFATQTKYLQNGAYLRLKNIQLGYTIPSNITEKVKISKLRFYVSGENLVTFTKMSDIFDPETTGGDWGNGKIYPLSKVISAGLSLTF
ncbi:TonB-dependent receptor [Aureibaculum algae]|uniref:TonB-dependent receptor n=1 Tax=Aureibaculum algae TaxID=2584122 RepID=A0A5B7TVD4_9FLAO|nr:TonB-dependent receptor [Aureibaculum algae]QCX38602.1 TonB-dependent receptor [Aureibaculum algae]